MSTLNAFLKSVEEIVSRDPAYKLGHSGLDGFCDCIGLVIGALSLSGTSWPGIHGSNWAARYAVPELRPLARASDLKRGDLVFKAHEPGADRWDLPDRYAGHRDQRDYYHVGVVISTDPPLITHMTTPAPKTDTALGQWKFTGTLRYLTDKEEPASLQTAVVTSPDGNPVKLRSAPDTGKPYLVKLNPGSGVTVLEKAPDWCRVEIDGLKGYMMTEFLAFKEAPDSDTVTVTLPRALVSVLMDALSKSKS